LSRRGCGPGGPGADVGGPGAHVGEQRRRPCGLYVALWPASSVSTGMLDLSAVPPHGLFIKTQVARAHVAADKGIADDRVADNGTDDDRGANDGSAGTGCAALSADQRVAQLCGCTLHAARRAVRMRRYPVSDHRFRSFDHLALSTFGQISPVSRSPFLVVPGRAANLASLVCSNVRLGGPGQPNLPHQRTTDRRRGCV
jgi:hypothetical protein